MLTKEEYQQYLKELKTMYTARRIMLPFGLVFLLGSIPLIIAISAEDSNFSFLGGLAIFFMISGIVILILRSALFNTRIRNRKRAIQQTKQELEMLAMYEKKDERVS